jgi:hypothetical protein
MSYNNAFPGADSATVTQLQGTGMSSGTAGDFINEISTQESNDLIRSLNAADASSNNAYGYATYLNRNQAVQDIAKNLTEENRKRKAPADTLSRQAEINEWQAENKYDTLFFFQVLFLYFCVAVISFYFRQAGIFPSTVVYMILGLGGLIVLGVLWNRASYTYSSRDKRYWNRRFLGLEDSGLSAKLQCALTT